MLVTLGAGGCATSSMARRDAAMEPQPVEDLAAGELRDHHRHQHRGGIMQFVAMSLDTLGPEDAKRAQVEQIQRDLYACMAPTGEINRQLQLAVATGVAAGAIDPVQVDALVMSLDASTGAVQACGADALARLHWLLSPEERQELAEKVEAHWQVWRQVNDEPGARVAGGRLAELTVEVDLSTAQVGQIEAALHLARAGRPEALDRARADANVHQFAEAFASETFDAKAMAARAGAHLATHGAGRMAAFYETVAPLLTPSQRVALSEHLRERAAHHPVLSAN
jgi:Spy/CpxP family protein refolding chaperone